MALENFDGHKHAIEVLCGVLGVSKTFLAGMLGVTERSLSEWESLGSGESTPKSKRLVLLYNIVQLISKDYSNIPPKAYRDILENSRIEFDPNDAEDGSISLMNLVVTEPEEKFWPTLTKKAVQDYLNFLTSIKTQRNTGNKIEANRPVQLAR